MIPAGFDVAALLCRTKKPIDALAWRHGIDCGEAQLQHAALVLENAHKFDPEHVKGACIDSFLIGKTRYWMLEERRRASRFESLDALADCRQFATPELDDEPEQRWITASDSDPAISGRLGIVPPIMREIALLVLDGFSLAEAAEALNKSEKQVHDLFGAAVRMLEANPAATQLGFDFGGAV